MKKLKLLAITIMVIIGALLYVRPASAQVVMSRDNLGVGASETIPTTLFANGSSINIEGTIDGDFYCTGSNVVISGTINGDVFCFTQSMNISGRVNGSVRAVSTDTNISGTITKNTVFVGQNFILTNKGNIGGDLLLAGSDAKINGTIGRDAGIYAQNVEIGGTVGRNVSGRIGKLTLNSTADVSGSIVYTGDAEPIRMSGAKVAGNLTRNVAMTTAGEGGTVLSLAFGFLIFMASLLIVSMSTVWAFPRFYDKTYAEISSSIGKTSLYGLANIILVPIVGFTLLFTVVGTPLAALVFVAWILSLILCGPVFAYYIGSKVLAKGKNSKNVYAKMFVGSVVVLLLYAVPVVNLFVGLAVAIVGSGAIMAHFKSANTKTKKAS